MTYKQLVSFSISLKRENSKKYKYMSEAVDNVLREYNKRKSQPYWSEDELISKIAEDFIYPLSEDMISPEFPGLISQLKAYKQCTIKYLSIHAIQDLIEHLSEGNSKNEVAHIMRDLHKNIKLEDFNAAWTLLNPNKG